MPRASELLRPGFDPYADTAGEVSGIFDDIGGGIASVGKSFASVAKAAAPVVTNTLVPIARTALKNSGPWGMVANGTISAMEAGLSGKNIGNIALAAAQGAAPSGIDSAIGAGAALARGDNVLNTAMKHGAQAFAPGTGERFAYSLATDALRKGALKPDLGAARRALQTEGQRRAFDAAVGTLSRAAGGGVAVRPSGGLFSAIRRAATAERPFSVIRPTLAPPVQLARLKRPIALDAFSISPNRFPLWRPLSPFAARFVRARAPFVSNVALIGDVGTLSGGAIAANMPLIKNIGDRQPAVRILQDTLRNKFKPSQVTTGVYDMATFNTVKAFQSAKGLGRPDGAVGQMTWSALELSPSLSTPPQVSPTITTTPTVPIAVTVPISTGGGGLAGGARAADMPIIQAIGDKRPQVTTLQLTLKQKFSPTLVVTGVYDTVTFNTVKKFQAARGLKVDGSVGPSTWAALEGPTAQPGTPIVLSPPVVGDQVVNPAATIQAKAILAAWGKSDGLTEAGLQDYGSRAEDTSATIGPRDKLMIVSFARWNNKTFGTTLPTDGALSPSISDALRLWAEKKAAAGVAVATGAAPVPALPTLGTAPGPTPTVTPAPTTLPALPAPVVPATLTVPAGGPPPFVPTTPIFTGPTVPAGGPLISPPPAREPVPAAAPAGAAPPPAKDSTLAMAGGGGLLGFLVGGIPGALIGAAAGAAAGSMGK